MNPSAPARINVHDRTHVSFFFGFARRRFALAGALLLAASIGGCALLVPFNSNFGSGAPQLSQIARELEEADIVKLENGFFYVANPFTGLRIVDARDIDEPRLMGRVALGGRAVELYVRDGLVYVLTASDFINCAGQTVGFAEGIFDPQITPDYDGSRLWVVDVSDAAAPAVTTTLDFDGFVQTTRRVGDVIYAAGNAFVPVEDENGEDNAVTTVFERAAFVTSINIADPENAVVVDTEFFAGTSLDVHVRDDAMFVFGGDSGVFETSIVTYVDISDPGGDITVRDQIRIPGRILDEFAVDVDGPSLRVVTDQFIPSVFAEVVALFVFDISDPDDITRSARLPIVIDGRLRAVRFDGNIAYAETSRRDSPLTILDLSDPSNPTISATLPTPGFGTQLRPLGERLVAVGFDTSLGVRPAIVLYDVSNPASPRELDRVIVGDQFTFDTTSTATVDEKALRVIEEAGLILLPFSTFDRETGLFTDGIQFIELGETSLVERGTISHTGFVRRADQLDRRIWVLSDESFQSVDIDDLDAPSSLGTLTFIDEQDLLDSGLSGCADAARRLSTRLSGGVASPCGVLGMVSLVGMFAGFGFLRMTTVGSWLKRG